ncbi:hypothetical protein ACFSL4_00540 [Streptomyces caeni]|uniref:Uncharacterized protein n=1 Tax=Streptomyces caeni TaxID=2307231 RepID=A0ABW4IHG5_9ACTN
MTGKRRPPGHRLAAVDLFSRSWEALRQRSPETAALGESAAALPPVLG